MESTSCYLDGRYFDSVMNGYDGYLENCMYINVNDIGCYAEMEYCHLNEEHINFSRIVVKGNNNQHSMLLMIDQQYKEIGVYDPSRSHNNTLHNLCMEMIEHYFSRMISNGYILIDVETPEPENEDLSWCDVSGVCNALVLKYAYNIMNGEEFTWEDVKNIRYFMNEIETNYTLSNGTPDIEYDWTEGQTFGTLGGLAGGALIGGAIGGPTGALVGAGLGGVGGYAIGSNWNR